MVKEEYANIKNLLKLRLKLNIKGFVWLLVILSLIIFVPFSESVVRILRGDGIIFYNMADFSIALLIFVGGGFFVQTLMYKGQNDALSVFPQTNNSRFVSSLLCNFIVAFGLVGFVLAVFLVRHFVILLLGVFVDNLYFALDFSVGLMVVGFFVYVIYSLLLVSFFELVGVILRKWTYYAIVAFTAALSLILANMNTVVESLPYVFGFLTGESSVILFFAKAIVILLAINALSFFINNKTVYYKNHGSGLNKLVVIGCVAVTVAVTVILPLILFNGALTLEVTSETQAFSGPRAIAAERSGYVHRDVHEVRIDISHLPNGSNINVSVEDRDISVDVVASMFISNRAPVSITGYEDLQSVYGDTLVIVFFPPLFEINGFRLTDFTSPQFIAYLDGNTLFVDAVMDDVQAVFLPVWGIARQFDVFRDRNIFREPMLGFSGGGNITTNAWVRVE
jgi:hypothetical protein